MAIEGIVGSNLDGLHDLKLQANLDASKDVSEIAKQFEAIFLQTALKSTLIEQHFNTLMEKNHEAFQYIPDVQHADKMAVGPDVSMETMLAMQLEQMVHNSSNTTDPVFSVSQAANLPQQLAVSTDTPAEKKTSGTNQSADDFVRSIWPCIKQASSMIGIDPKVLMAQAALETGWGQFIAKDSDGSSSNNLFNIKASAAYSGQSVNIKTTEFIDDAPVKMVASFKKYLSVEHSLNDYISLIKNSDRYKTALANVNDPKRYIDALQGAGYATDPNYADKIFSIYHSDELQHALERNGYAQS